MSQVGVVAGREFLSTVRRRSYLIVTLGMPFFLSAYIAVVGLLPALFMSRSGTSLRPIGLVDLANVVPPGVIDSVARERDGAGAGARDLMRRLTPGSARGNVVTALLEDFERPLAFVKVASKDEALRQLREGRVQRVFVLPVDYLRSGAVETYQSEAAPMTRGTERADGALSRILRQSLVAGRLDEEVGTRLEQPIDSRASSSFLVRADGRVEPDRTGERLARMVIPGVFAMLLLMSLLTTAGYLLRGVEEKENRVIEVILSSVTPQDLLFGKLLGLGAAGLLQLGVWVTVAGFASSLVAAAALAYLDWKLFLFCLLFFVGGYMMVGSLMTGTGALGTNARESQQFSVIWTLCLVIPPAVTWMLIMDDPNSWMARLLGWFPLTGPLTMMIRLGTGKVPAWDAGVALACLAAGVYISIRGAAALFRLGLLMYGKRPSLREIVRQLRHA
jgi:ABC-2 type transport system permease protein